MNILRYLGVTVHSTWSKHSSSHSQTLSGVLTKWNRSFSLLNERTFSAKRWNYVFNHEKFTEASHTIQEHLNLSRAHTDVLLYNSKSTLKLTNSELVSAIELIKSINLSIKDIIVFPKILSIHPKVIERRYYNLKEFGFKPYYVNAENILNYDHLLVQDLTNFSPKQIEGDIIDNLINLLQISEEEKKKLRLGVFNDGKDPKTIRQVQTEIYRAYMKLKLLQVAKPIYAPRKINTKFKYLAQNLDFLTKAVNLKPNTVHKYQTLLAKPPEKLKESHDFILSLLKETKEKRSIPPKILHYSSEHYKSITNLLLKNGFTLQQIVVNLMILKEEISEIERKVTILKSIPEFEVFLTYDRSLVLVLEFEVAMIGLDAFRKTDCKQISLQGFMKFSKQVSLNLAGDRMTTSPYNVLKITYHGYENMKFLSDHLSRPLEEVRKQVQRHPDRNNLANLLCKRIVLHLESMGFSHEQIFNGLYIVLYDLDEINGAIDALSSTAVQDKHYKDWQKHPLALDLVILQIEKMESVQMEKDMYTQPC